MQIKCETQTGETVLVDSKKIELRVSAYGILKIENKLLVVKTNLPLWEFPGGAPEQGESLLSGLKREFEEEVGLAIIPGNLALIRESFYVTPSGINAFHSFQHYFNVELCNSSNIENVGTRIDVAIIEHYELNQNNMNKSAFEALDISRHNSKKHHFIQ